MHASTQGDDQFDEKSKDFEDLCKVRLITAGSSCLHHYGNPPSHTSLQIIAQFQTNKVFSDRIRFVIRVRR